MEALSPTAIMRRVAVLMTAETGSTPFADLGVHHCAALLFPGSGGITLTWTPVSKRNGQPVVESSTFGGRKVTESPGTQLPFISLRHDQPVPYSISYGLSSKVSSVVKTRFRPHSAGRVVIAREELHGMELSMSS